MSNAAARPDSAELPDDPFVPAIRPDQDPAETAEWLDALEWVLSSKGEQRVQLLLEALQHHAKKLRVDFAFTSSSPYANTIAPEEEPEFPGDREMERRIKSLVRWNAMAMVVAGNKRGDGIGGHLSTFASSATLYEICFNHFFRGRGESKYDGDQIYFQGHASPGIYSRAFLEGRLSEEHLRNFRRELQDHPGLSSYPHPWLMPYFWDYPSVSMGLAPIMAIYQARFNEYLHDRGIKDTTKQKVWAFLGDGECDEPETLGAITLASRERLDNLIFVINCNLQRLDGPVRGNGKIIQELESLFRGAGWNVIKCVWGSAWDELLARDESGLLLKRMGEVVDGEFQKYTLMPGSYIRENFFGKYPELLEMVKDYSDEDIERLRRGGHDPVKVYAAFKRAVETKGRPTVVLAKTIKGYGLGESAEGQNVAHNKKKLEKEDLLAMRNRFGIPLSDEQATEPAFYRPPETSPEMKYLRSRREALGGYAPARPVEAPTMPVPSLADYSRYLAGSKGREVSTTFGFVELLRKLVKDKKIGKNCVPIVPDESRTFGMEGMFREIGIYAHSGQLYEPVDADQLQYYKEAQDGQILEEGINEAGSMASFIAAGTAYSAHGVNMIPFYIYYSMFGFQRVGDLIWAAADARAKGFLLGGTAGRTTLNGEGLQHQDGHSLLNAIAFPTVRAYDPAFNYETTVIIMDGIDKLYAKGETAIYYIMVGNEAYEQPEMPPGIEEGIVRGLYKFRSVEAGKTDATLAERRIDKSLKVNLLGSGAIMNCVLKAQTLLAEKYGISSDVWSAPSYTELRRDAHKVERWNMLHPGETPKRSYVEECFAGEEKNLFVSASDNVRALAEQIKPYVPGEYYCLGTDGMGRSESRRALRRHFEVDAECITLAVLYRLARRGDLPVETAASAVKDLGIDPDKIDPYFA